VKKVAPELAAARDIGAGESPEMIELGQKIFRNTGDCRSTAPGGRARVAGTDQAVPGHSLIARSNLRPGGHDAARGDSVSYAVPAQVMGLQAMGTVEVGKKADLIVLGGNPLESIRNIRRSEGRERGTLYDSRPLWQSVGFKP